MWNWNREDERERESHAGQKQVCQTVFQAKKYDTNELDNEEMDGAAEQWF